MMEFLSALAGWKLPSVATAASLPAPANQSTEGLDRLRDEVVPVLTEAVKYLGVALDRSEHRFVCLGYGITWWRSHERDVGYRLRRPGLPQTASRLDRISSDLLGDICAILEVTARKGRSLFKRERRAHRRPRIPAGNLRAICKARSTARLHARALLRELELVRKQLAPTEPRITTDAAADGKPNGTTPKKPGKRKQTRKRAKRMELTRKQQAVVELVEVHSQTFPEIARCWKCKPQAVHQLYNRAQQNPAYKPRTVNLRKAKSLHDNTQVKCYRSADE